MCTDTEAGGKIGGLSLVYLDRGQPERICFSLAVQGMGRDGKRRDILTVTAQYLLGNRKAYTTPFKRV